MRVAVVSDAIYPCYIGGKEKRSYKIASQLTRNGHDVHLYTMSPTRPTNRAVDIDNICFHFISRKIPMYRNGKRSLIQALYFSVCVLKLIFEPFDVLDVDQVPLAPIWSASIVCTLKRKPMIATWHEYWDREYWKAEYGILGLPLYVFQKLTARRPDYLVAVSQETKDKLQKVTRKSQALRVIPNAVDFEIVRKARPANIGSDMIFVGRLQAHKRIDLLIETVNIIRGTRKGVRCLIVGSGPELNRLHARVTELRLNNNVHILDDAKTEEEIFSLMKASKIFILPSEREGFSLVTLEAIACGIPVITVARPLNNAQSLVEETGIGSVTASDPNHLAQAANSWLDAQKLPRLSGDFLSYSWASAAEATAVIYLEALLRASR
jgi:glycosyltransferase involved in cell wall biosynthesis